MSKKEELISDRYCFCGEKIDIPKMGTLDLTVSEAGPARFIGKSPTTHIGSIDILVCMNCGCLFTNMRGQIKIGIAK